MYYGAVFSWLTGLRHLLLVLPKMFGADLFAFSINLPVKSELAIDSTDMARGESHPLADDFAPPNVTDCPMA